MDSKDILALPFNCDLEMMKLNEPYDCSNLTTIITTLKFTRSPSTSRKERRKNFHELQSLRGNYISNTDRNKGHLAEQAFAEALERHGLKCYELPHYSHNYMLHVDFEVENAEGLCCWIDVKSAKALRKTRNPNDPFNKPQDRYVCIELNATGSLFGGQADYFAFGLTSNAFLLAERLKLVDTVNKKMGTPMFRSAWPETALWCPYVRTYEGHSLVMSYMDLNDLPIECLVR